MVPRGLGTFFFVIVGSPRECLSLSLEGLVKEVYRAFIVSVGEIQGFSFVALYPSLSIRGCKN